MAPALNRREEGVAWASSAFAANKQITGRLILSMGVDKRPRQGWSLQG